MQQGQLINQCRSILRVLEVRLGVVSMDIVQELSRITDGFALEELLRKAVVVPSLQDFRATLQQIANVGT